MDADIMLARKQDIDGIPDKFYFYDANGKLNVPDNPIIPYIEGDGIGVDISPVMIDVVNASVAKAYGGQRKVHWAELYLGEKAAGSAPGLTNLCFRSRSPSVHCCGFCWGWPPST